MRVALVSAAASLREWRRYCGDQRPSVMLCVCTVCIRLSTEPRLCALCISLGGEGNVLYPVLSS